MGSLHRIFILTAAIAVAVAAVVIAQQVASPPLVATTEIEGSTPDALARAFKAAGVEIPANLPHALIFATAGEFVRSIAAGEGCPRYEPYWIREGFETFDGWSHLVAPVNQHWLPIVRGETSRDVGLTALAASFGR